MEFSNSIIEYLFQKFKTVLGKDHDKYKNHVYRVFLNCLLLDDTAGNEKKYAIAAVFHDIGIWTDHTIDYLEPSIQQVEMYLTETEESDLVAEISLMINWHHKTSRYKGELSKTVETFRKADWMDVSFGIFNFGIDKQKLAANRKKIPNLGFHVFLLKKIVRNLFKHPLNPLPMFKS